MLVNHCPCWQLFCQELGHAAGAAQDTGHEPPGKASSRLRAEYALPIPEAVPSLSPCPVCCHCLYPTPGHNSALGQLQPPAKGDHRVWRAGPPAQSQPLLPPGGCRGELLLLKRCEPLWPGRMSWSYRLWNASSTSLRMHRTGGRIPAETREDHFHIVLWQGNHACGG